MSIDGRGVQSIESGGRLLRVLSEAGRPMMLRDLAAKAQMPPGQAHAYLVSFRKLDLVEQERATGRYRLGPFALRLGLARLREVEPFQVAEAAIIELAEAVGLAAALSVWGTCGPTVVHLRVTSHRLHANIRLGTVFDLMNTATGKLFAAFLPAAETEPLLRPAAAPPGLDAEIAAIRRHGIAVTTDRPIPGISALAAPVFDHLGQIQLAVTLMGPTAAVDVALEGTHATALLAFTRGISQKLGAAA